MNIPFFKSEKDHQITTNIINLYQNEQHIRRDFSLIFHKDIFESLLEMF